MDPPGKTLAIDFDGVIANSDSYKVKFAREKLGLDVTEHSMKRHHFMKLYGSTRGFELYNHIIKSVYHSELMLEIPMMPYASECIESLQAVGWRCVVVTSRSGSIDDKKSSTGWAWRLLHSYNINFQESNFINVNNKSKLDACVSLNAYGLVDDDYPKLLPVIEEEIKGFLFSTKTNQKVESEYPTFLGIRVKNWKHLRDILTSKEL